MEEKIKKTLAILDNLDTDVWFDQITGCGFIFIHHRCLTSSVLDLITKVVDLVAIVCTAPDTYRVTFMTK